MKKSLEIVLLVGIAIGFGVLGIYVYINKTILFAGKLTGNVYPLSPPGDILVTSACFAVALSLLMLISNSIMVAKIAKNLLIAAFILFTVGVFL